MRLAPLLLAALAAVVLFSGLGRTGLLDFREARDAQVARELILAREPLTPVLGHERRFEKPVLAYAPEVAVRILSKEPDLRSRQLRAAAALVLLLLVASIGARHFGTRAGWFGACVLATSLALPLAARTDGTQLLATLLAWVACSAFADSVFGREDGGARRGMRSLGLVVGYGALAAAFVTCGPLPALWPLGGLALYFALARTRNAWQALQPLAGMVLIAGLALPWYGAMFERHGTAFLASVPGFPYAGDPRAAWYSGPVLTLSFLAIGFFPWISLLPAAMLHAATWWRPRRPRDPALAAAAAPAWTDPAAREHREESAAHLLITWFVAALVPILVYPAPPLPAVLPALPAAALLAGRFLDHLFENAARLVPPFSRATLMLALFGTSFAILIAVLAGRLHEPAAELRLLATALFATSWLPFLAVLLGRHRTAAALMLLPVAIAVPLVTLRLLPAGESYLSSREVAETMGRVSPPRAPLILIDAAPPTLRLYGRRNLVVETPARVVRAANRSADGLVYVAFRPLREREMARAADAPLEVLIRTPSLVLARIPVPR